VITPSNEALPQPRAVIGNYVFRDVVHYPLTIAGYLFAPSGWVPRLSAMLQSTLPRPCEPGWLERAFGAGGRLARQAASVTARASIAALTEQLVHESAAGFATIDARFARPATLAPANGWASALDSLVVGFLAAGPRRPRDGRCLAAGGRGDCRPHVPDAAAPRRLAYEVDSEALETSVGAGLLPLWFVTDRRRRGGHQHYLRDLLPRDGRGAHRLAREVSARGHRDRGRSAARGGCVPLTGASHRLGSLRTKAERLTYRVARSAAQLLAVQLVRCRRDVGTARGGAGAEPEQQGRGQRVINVTAMLAAYVSSPMTPL